MALFPLDEDFDDLIDDVFGHDDDAAQATAFKSAVVELKASTEVAVQQALASAQADPCKGLTKWIREHVGRMEAHAVHCAHVDNMQMNAGSKNAWVNARKKLRRVTSVD